MSRLAEALRMYQDERYEEAIRLLQPITLSEPDNVQAWMYFGAATGQLGQWDSAVRAFRQVVRLQPENASSYCDLAAALLEQGDTSAAAEAVASALLLEPGHPVAVQLQERLGEQAETAPSPAEDPAPGPPAPGAEQQQVAARRRAAEERFGLEPIDPEPEEPRQWLPYLLVALAVLLVIAGVKWARKPTEAWRKLAHAEALLDRAAEQRQAVSNLPGEDFEVVDRVRRLEDDADRLLHQVLGQRPSLPEAHYLLGRVLWVRDGRALAARNELMEALALLEPLPPEQRRPSGETVAALRARTHRLLARIGLATSTGAGAAESLARALRDIARAKELASTPQDEAIERQIQEALKRLDARTRRRQR